jgi:hypothetical protein
MLTFPLSLLLPDGTFPRLNDCLAGQEKLNHQDLYEFAWFICDPQYAAVLQFTETTPDERETLLWRERPCRKRPAADPAAVAVCARRRPDVMAATAAGAAD